VYAALLAIDVTQALYDESKTPLAQAQAAIQSLHQELDVFRHREDKFRKDVEVYTTTTLLLHQLHTATKTSYANRRYVLLRTIVLLCLKRKYSQCKCNCAMHTERTTIRAVSSIYVCMYCDWQCCVTHITRPLIAVYLHCRLLRETRAYSR
jgi:hypothetical protein